MELPDYSGSKVVNVTNADALNNSKLQEKHFQEQMNAILARKREEQIKKARSNAKVEKYLNTMPDGIDTSKLPAKYQPGVQDWAKSKQLEFAELAQQAANYESNGDFTNSIAIKSRMTEIENSFKNVDSQLTQFKSYKDNFLEDSQNGMVSNSVNPYKRDLLSSVYTDELDMTFSDDGNITFLNEEGGYINFNEIPDYTVKNNKGASEILNMNEAIYKSGVMSPSSERLYRMKLQNITKSRDDVLSLATDDFITEGGLGILDDDLLYNEERTDELRDMVIDSYMGMFKETAATSIKEKANKTRTKTRSGSATERKYGTVLNNMFKGLSNFANGDGGSLTAYSKGQFLDNEDGTGDLIYSDEVIFLDKELNENTIYRILKKEGVPDNMIPSLEEIREMINGGSSEEQATEPSAADLIAKYSN